jgi:hypothetical protein
MLQPLNELASQTALLNDLMVLLNELAVRRHRLETVKRSQTGILITREKDYYHVLIRGKWPYGQVLLVGG